MFATYCSSYRKAPLSSVPDVGLVSMIAKQKPGDTFLQFNVVNFAKGSVLSQMLTFSQT